MKLQFLIPQYKETEEVIKPLLDSIALQQNVDFNEIGAIICNDGTDISLSEEFLNSYKFKIDYIKQKHKGVSAARNECLRHATAEYVMFCDADDMFFNACGVYVIFCAIKEYGFDTLVSTFVEETRNPETGEVVYVNREGDKTFVHGKVHRREYLTDNSIFWNEHLTIHEDSYFNILCQTICDEKKAVYCPTKFYLWKWRDDSVCRHDPKYILKTYNNMLDSNTALVEELLLRAKTEEAKVYATSMVYDAYFLLNKDEWIDQENQEYRNAVELRFAEWFKKFEHLYNACPKEIRAQIVMGIKNRMFQEGLLMETQTFDDWIEHIKQMIKK